MLAAFLEDHREELLEGAAARIATDESLGHWGYERREQLDALIRDLIGALGAGEATGTPPALGPGGAAAELRARELIRVELIAQAERSGVKIATKDMAIVSDWLYRADRDRLREGYRRLSDLLDEVRDGVALFGPDGRFEYVNRRFAADMNDAFGVPINQIVGKSPAELGIRADGVWTRKPEELKEHARRGTSGEALWRGRWKEGRVKAIYSPGGEVVAVALVGRDIHKPRLRRIRVELLSKLSASVGVHDSDDIAETLAQVPIPELADWCVANVVDNNRILHTSVAHRDPAKAGLRDALLAATAHWDRHPLWVEMGLTSGFQLLTHVSDELLRKLAGGDEQYRLLCATGVRSLMVQPVFARGQTVALLTLIFTGESGRRYDRDDPVLAHELALHLGHIVENARLLKDLRATADRFRMSLAGARTVVFEQDTSLRYVWFHGPHLSQSMIGKTDADLLPAGEAAAFTERKRGVLEQGKGVSGEVSVTWDGERRQYRDALEPMRNQAGKIVGIVGSAIDITEEKRVQRALSDAVCFRDQMIGILSHDLRNPLGAAAMGVETLRRKPSIPQDAQKYLNVIANGMRRMQEMIESLLDFTRVRLQGKLPLAPAPVDLGVVVGEVSEEARGGHPGRAIDVDVRGDVSGTWDRGRVTQALSNLVANAIAYGDPQTPVCVLAEAEGTDAVLRVTNRGPAIAPERLPTIFEPFRERANERGRPRGLGLGLYIVKEIAQAHGGSIDVASTADDGTTFTLRLPGKNGAGDADG
jgi:signal transduction histidine kinase